MRSDVSKFLKNSNEQDCWLDVCVRMAHHSTAIEGNTLSQDETASILLDGYISKATSEREFYCRDNLCNFCFNKEE